ncbi:MAG: hypothetical protein BWX88_05331 [Planctomycetes bacterium ADurb.Bin126]|nr:MAG: hypothetical protein BWX88_05331 [Planctomycetes bacterium ADurb.Bin126]
MPEQAGESALDDVRWEDMTLASLGIDKGTCLHLSELRPPVVTVGDWEDLVASGRTADGNWPFLSFERDQVEEAVEAWRKGLPR